MTESRERIGGDAERRDLRSAIAQDLSSSGWPQRLLLLVSVAWLAYEWGWGNETVTPWLLVRVIDRSSGLASVLAAFAVGFTFTTCQQLASGFTTAAGFSIFPRFARVGWERLRGRLVGLPRSWSDIGWPARVLLVFSLGTTAVVLIEMSLTGRVGVRAHRNTVIQAAVLCGFVVGVIGGTIAALLWAGRSNQATSDVTDVVFRVVGNPLLWVSLVILLFIGSSIARRLQRS